MPRRNYNRAMAPVLREMSDSFPHPDDLRNYVEYLRDLGIYDLLVQTEPAGQADTAITAWTQSHLRASNPTGQADPTRRLHAVAGHAAGQPSSATGRERARISHASAVTQVPHPPAVSPFDQAQQRRSNSAARPPARSNDGPAIHIGPAAASAPAFEQTSIPAEAPTVPTSFFQDMPAPTSFNQLAPLPCTRVAASEKASALTALRSHIGDCTRCPLAYAGRHSIVFADGDSNAKLMFVGEGPGADEDEQGFPFVGKAGQLLNNMIGAMGLRREQVYIANIVKCRPPKNRVPEPVEANTCSPFLLQQIDIVQPEVIVALGGTAATYLLGVKQSLTSLRGKWFEVRGSKCAVTYHPAFLLRDPRQKGEAWKDLQRVMTELKLKPPART